MLFTYLYVVFFCFVFVFWFMDMSQYQFTLWTVKRTLKSLARLSIKDLAFRLFCFELFTKIFFVLNRRQFHKIQITSAIQFIFCFIFYIKFSLKNLSLTFNIILIFVFSPSFFLSSAHFKN